MPSSGLPAPFSLPFRTPPVLSPVRTDATTDYYRVVQQQALVEILPGKQTAIFGYNGIAPGPTIMAERDRPVVVQQINSLPPVHPTLGYTPYVSVHLHGSPSLPEYDGYASDVIQPGQWKNYHYPNNHPACTFWYHDHAVGITAENAYFGLAAMYELHDDLERSLGLPSGAYDVPLIIKDAMFAAGRVADLRRSRPLGAVRRCHPRERRAVARDARRAAQVPLPHAQRFGLTFVPLPPLDRRAVHHDRRRQRVRSGATARRRLPLRDGGALRDDHRLLEVSDRPAGRAAEPAAEEQHRVRQHRQGHGIRRRRRRLDARRQHDPGSAQSRRGDHGPDGGRRRQEPQVRVRAQARGVDDQRAYLGRRDRQRLHPPRSAPGLQRRRDLGVQEHQRRLVPPGAHPPDRLQDPRSQRAPAVRLREGAEGRDLPRRERDRAHDRRASSGRSGAT